MLVVVAPGQGAQTPGFLSPWLESPTFKNGLEWLSAVAGMDLLAHGTVSDAATITNTAVAQPLLVASGILVARELFDGDFSSIDLVAGHSVGELTASVLSGVLSAESAMVFVRERGAEMAKAANATPTGMSAVIAGKEEDVLARIEELGLTAANHNGSGQIVAAGSLEKLAELAANPPERTRVIPLQVAGAFHTHYMASAVDRLETLAHGIPTAAPQVPMLSNRDGAQVTDGTDLIKRLVGQVSLPVRWDLCMNEMADRNITGMLELAPAGTLTGIAKRNLKHVERFALNSPDELDSAKAFCAEHAGTAELHL